MSRPSLSPIFNIGHPSPPTCSSPTSFGFSFQLFRIASHRQGPSLPPPKRKRTTRAHDPRRHIQQRRHMHTFTLFQTRGADGRYYSRVEDILPGKQSCLKNRNAILSSVHGAHVSLGSSLRRFATPVRYVAGCVDPELSPRAAHGLCRGFRLPACLTLG